MHVPNSTVLKESTIYAREIVDGYFRKYTQIDVIHIESNNHTFLHLNVDSRLEIAFASKPK